MKLIEWIRRHLLNKDVRNGAIALVLGTLLYTVLSNIWSAIPSLRTVFAGFGTALKVAAAASWEWLKTPTSMPLGIALLTLIAFAALYRWLIQQNRRTLSVLRSGLALAVQAEAEANARNSEPNVQTPSPMVPNTGPPLPPIESLDRESFQLLSHLTRKYPEGISTLGLSRAVGVTFAQAEQMLESLDANGYIKYVRGNYTHDSYWMLTSAGRNVCNKYVTPKG